MFFNHSTISRCPSTRDTSRWSAPFQRTLHCLTVAILTSFASEASAQTGNGYDLTWSTIDSGGVMFSAGNGYELGGTIGQADAGALTGPNGYSLTGGFWAAGVACVCQLFGDVVDVNSMATPDCQVDVSDILCVLDDFADTLACAGNGDIVAAGGGCVPDGIIDVDDILAVLGAFSGIFGCPHPCSP